MPKWVYAMNDVPWRLVNSLLLPALHRGTTPSWSLLLFGNRSLILCVRFVRVSIDFDGALPIVLVEQEVVHLEWILLLCVRG
jgi:hypothetical protein